MKHKAQHSFRGYHADNGLHALCRLWVLALCLLIGSLHGARASQAPHSWYRHLSALPSEALHQMGNDYLFQQNNPDSALACYTILANRSIDDDRQQQLLIVKAHVDAAYIYCGYYYNLTRAFQYAQRAEELAKTYHLQEVLATIYTDYCYIYSIMSMFQGTDHFNPEAIAYLKKAYWASAADKSSALHSICMSNIASACICNGLEKELRAEVRNIISHSVSKQAPNYNYLSLIARGLKKYVDKDYVTAAATFRTMAVPFVNSTSMDSLRMACNAYNMCYKSLLRGHQHAEALSVMHSIERIATEAKLEEVLIDLYHDMHLFYSGQGNSDQANAYDMKYLRAKESFLRASNVIQVDKMRFQNEIDNVTEDLHAEQQRHRQTRILMIIGTVVFVFICVVLSLLLRMYRDRERHVRQLYEKTVSLLNKASASTPEPAAKRVGETERPALSGDNTEAILRRISTVLSDTALTCSTDFSIARLADAVQSNVHYVSEVVNSHYGCSFKTLLTNLRIEEACRRLNDVGRTRNYTIDAIAEEVGFKSRSAFSVAFKKNVGITPSEFQREAVAAADRK